jgi:hypothetical protein
VNYHVYCTAGQATDKEVPMRVICLIPKATGTHTHTHTEYVTLIAVPLQQWLHERTLRYMYVHGLLATN